MPFNILEEVSNVNLDELAEPLDITDGFGDIDLISTDNIYSSNPFYKFPQDIISEKQHVNFMILAPYAETMDPLTISNPIPDIVVTELAPIFLLLPSLRKCILILFLDNESQSHLRHILYGRKALQSNAEEKERQNADV